MSYTVERGVFTRAHEIELYFYVPIIKRCRSLGILVKKHAAMRVSYDKHIDV